MARPKRCRRICREPAYGCFIPDGIPGGNQITMTLEEYETLRLMDLEKLTHQQCAVRMNISRTTVTELYDAAREKIADALVHGKPLRIQGGSYQLCDGTAPCVFCPRANGSPLPAKGAIIMRIAVTYENGEVFQHFGHTSTFKLYDVEKGAVVSARVVDTNGQGHGALAGFLRNAEVDTLICGGIGSGAKAALSSAGITLYGGVTGSADEAVAALLAGELSYDPGIQCSHHSQDHSGSCGSHGCGNS